MKQYFVGITLASTAANETGLSVLNRDLEIIKLDKLYTDYEIEDCIDKLSFIDQTVICIEIPKDTTMLGKWRYESKKVNYFGDSEDGSSMSWTNRISQRIENLPKVIKEGKVETFFFFSNIAKQHLKLETPYKHRTQVACRILQVDIKNRLQINGIPKNLISVSNLNAIIGSYTGWCTEFTQENEGYQFIGELNGLKIITPLG